MPQQQHEQLLKRGHKLRRRRATPNRLTPPPFSGRVVSCVGRIKYNDGRLRGPPSLLPSIFRIGVRKVAKNFCDAASRWRSSTASGCWKTKATDEEKNAGEGGSKRRVCGGGRGQHNRLVRSKAFSRAESLRRNGKSFFALEIFN